MPISLRSNKKARQIVYDLIGVPANFIPPTKKEKERQEKVQKSVALDYMTYSKTT